MMVNAITVQTVSFIAAQRPTGLSSTAEALNSRGRRHRAGQRPAELRRDHHPDATRGDNWINITKVPAPVMNGAAASGVWGVGELAKYAGSLADTVGREVYIDAKGQLRAKPDFYIPTAKAASDLPSTYPLGMSLTTLTGAIASAGGWPYGGTGEVVTWIRADSPLSASQTGFQIWCRNNNSLAEMQFRSGSDVAGWSPWKSFAGADTGWLPVTISGGFAGHATDPPRMRKIGNVVHLRGAWLASGMSPSNSYGVGTFPVGIEKPVGTYFLPAGVPAGEHTGQFLVGSGTGFQFQIRTGAVMATQYYLHGTYTID